MNAPREEGKVARSDSGAGRAVDAGALGSEDAGAGSVVGGCEEGAASGVVAENEAEKGRSSRW